MTTLRLWKSIVESPSHPEYAAILEDDAQLPGFGFGFEQSLQHAIMNLVVAGRPDVDVIYMDMRTGHGREHGH